MRRRDKKSISWLFVLCLGGAVVFAAASALATEARWNSMRSNPMVEDDQDIVDFPGLLTSYSNFAFLTVMPAATSGNAGAVVGENIALGAWIHRDWRWNDLDQTDTLFGNFALPTTYSLFDLFFGMSNGFGLRLSTQAGLDTTDSRDLTDPDDEDLYSDGQYTFAIDVQPGYSLDTGSYRGDFGVGLTFSYFNVVENGQDAYSTGFVPSFLVRHRSIIDPTDTISWILDATVTRRAYSARSHGNWDDKASFGRWVAALVAGPRVRMPGNMTLWVGPRFRLEHLSGIADWERTSNVPEQPTATAFGIPGAVASAEVLLFDVWTIRAGIDYDVYWEIVRNKNDNDEVVSRDRGMGQSFGWSTGMGLSLGGFQIDGTVSNQLYFSGPDFIGGQAPGFLGMISAAYFWD